MREVENLESRVNRNLNRGIIDSCNISPIPYIPRISQRVSKLLFPSSTLTNYTLENSFLNTCEVEATLERSPGWDNQSTHLL